MKKSADFVHLHNHTQFSLLDGACRIDAFVELAVKLRFSALAITDHGNMFGAVEFYKKARKAGIKPIIGSEVYVAPKSRLHKEPVNGYPDQGNHLLLLARNEAGYRNLIKLSSAGFTEGFYHRPRIDKELLKEHADGLICTSACLQGEVAYTMLRNRDEEAKRVAFEFADMFGKENFFLEIQNHGIDAEDQVRDRIVKLATESGLSLVATNDCHYLEKGHAEAHDALLCIQTGKLLTDADRMRYHGDQLYLKSAEEMKEVFAAYPEAIENTLRIAERCNVEIELGKLHLPEFPLPERFANLDDYLTFQAETGLSKRYSKITPGIRERLEYELGVIKQMGYAGYFLIVADFIDEAHNLQVPVGPGRGSAAGSLVSYCLGITNIDPIKYDLLFERFLNPERISMPDIDIDFSDRGREKVIRYVINKYGEENVGQIITFGTMAARGVIRDVGRVLGIPYSEVDRIAKLVPFAVDMTIERALKLEPELERLAADDARIAKLLEFSKVLEGLARHASTHAAGVVIAPSRLTDFLPLYKGSKGEITTQYDMKHIEEIGLLKMDFLGLRTLTVIDDTIRNVAERHDYRIEIDRLPLDDAKVYELFGNGETIGIFQFESSGMREYLRKLKPESLNDLAAMNALYRPGPLKGGVVDLYIDRKHGKEKVEYEHPLLEPVLKDTYGVIVFQEQAMRIAAEMAGYSLGKSDILRKAMGKKNLDLMRAQKEEFVNGCLKNKIERKTADKVFDLIEKFAGYGFNKSHSVGYALLAYQTAYLKSHYPHEFMAALLSSEMESADRIIILMEECRRMGIGLLPPDVNESELVFSVVGEKIRFGLAAVKNVGHGAVEAMITARNDGERFESLFDFCTRVDSSAINRRAIESLVAAGAFDSVKGNRAQQFAAVEIALNFGHSLQKKEAINQADLFGSGRDDGTVQEPALVNSDEWSTAEILAREKEALGFYVSGHPLDKYRLEIAAFATANTETICESADGEMASIGGIIQALRISYDKQGRQMAFVTLEDFYGVLDVIIFADLFERSREYLRPDAMLLLRGKVNTREGEKPKIIGDQVAPLENIFEHRDALMEIFLNGKTESMVLERIKRILERSPGRVGVVLKLVSGNQLFSLAVSALRITPSSELVDQLAEVVGRQNLTFREQR
ncbi:MAG: DNA polymerase III subunit alpha [bacterium]